jgi:hypothetical protein
VNAAARLLAIAVLLLTPIAAWAQDGSGPLTIERVHEPFVIAPDYKVTHLNDSTGQLAGAYAGRLFDDVLFIGGGGYFLVDGSRGEHFGYGGALIGWSAPEWSGVRFGARGLVGFGTATLRRNFIVYRPVAFGAPPTATTVRLLARDDFFVFEPQATAAVGLFPHTSLTVAAGYRVTGATDTLRDRLNGVTGSAGLQFAW